MQTYNIQPQLVYYCLQQTPWGMAVIGLWQGKICYVGFAETKESGHNDISKQFPQSQIVETSINPIDWEGVLRGTSHYDVVYIGTDFQKSVWQQVASIPIGKTITYAQLAIRLKQPTATRAVASAVASNHLALFVPCHRIVHTLGTTHKYRWGAKLKKTLLEWEKENAKTTA